MRVTFSSCCGRSIRKVFILADVGHDAAFLLTTSKALWRRGENDVTLCAPCMMVQIHISKSAHHLTNH